MRQEAASILQVKVLSWKMKPASPRSESCVSGGKVETIAVHSKDGTTWLTKLDRIGAISARNQDTVFNNIGS